MVSVEAIEAQEYLQKASFHHRPQTHRTVQSDACI